MGINIGVAVGVSIVVVIVVASVGVVSASTAEAGGVGSIGVKVIEWNHDQEQSVLHTLS